MKSLVYGCAAAALLMGLAVQAHAGEIAVRDAPIHVVPADDDDTGPVVTPEKAVQVAQAQPAQIQPAQAAESAPVNAEPAGINALVQPKATSPAPPPPPAESASFPALVGRAPAPPSPSEGYVRRVTAIAPAFSGAASVQH